MRVTVDVSDETLTLVTDDRKIGIWSLDEIKVDSRSDGFHIWIEGEEAVLNVSESSRFASELQRTPPATSRPSAPGSVDKSNGYGPVPSVAGLGREDVLADARRQINDIREAMRDPQIPPSVVFGRWLALLKLLNRRHSQGAMPTPIFFRLNAELLDLMPVPAAAEPERVGSAVAV